MAQTNYHKFSSLTWIYYLTVLEVGSPKWVSLGYNQYVRRAVNLLGASGIVSLPFPTSAERYLYSLRRLLPSSNLFLTPTLAPLLSPIKTRMIRAHLDNPDSLKSVSWLAPLISPATLIPTCSVTSQSHRFLRLGCGQLWGVGGGYSSAFCNDKHFRTLCLVQFYACYYL